MTLDRRQALSLMTLSAAAGLAPHAQAQVQRCEFRHGVASGDPLADRVVLWTRVDADPSRAVELTWELAEDEGFTRPVASGRVEASPVHDHTAKVDAAGLRPGRDYWYRFTTDDVRSPVGRTRTLPAGPTSDVVLAFVSCALHPNGYFNAYDHLARSERLDAVIELGDYIYEYGAAPDDYGMVNGRRLGRIPEPAHDIVSLADYRARYSQYRRDRDLQAAHARAPWIAVWDDHEVANDTWRGGAENHHEKTQGAFDDRKAAALRAWYEWMPVRDPVPGRAWEAINRSFDFGDLASLVMVETRLTARSYQLEYDRPGDIAFVLYDMRDPAHPVRVTDAALVATAQARVATGAKPTAPYVFGPDTAAIEAFVADPRRQMLGEAQEAWLERTLASSAASGRPWQVMGNQVIMARCRSPKIARQLGPEKLAAALAAMPAAQRAASEKIIGALSFDQPFDLDGWDGYPAARARFDAIVQRMGAGNVVVVSGDSHAFWANQLHDAAVTRRLAVEFGTSAVTSPSPGDAAGFQLGEVFSNQNPEVTFCDQLAKGYVRLTLRPHEAVGEMIATTIDAKPYTARTLASFRLRPTAGAGVGPLERL